MRGENQVSVTKEELEKLGKTMHDLTEVLKDQQKMQSATIQDQVEATLKEVLRTHPGETPSRKVEFEKSLPTERDEILASMPPEVVKEMDNVVLLSKILRRPANTLKAWNRFTRVSGDFKKALDTLDAGSGAEWVPTEFSTQLLERVRLQTQVAALFPEIPMPSNPYELPFELGDFDTFVLAEQTEDTGQAKVPIGETDTTGKTTLTAKNHSSRILVSKEVEEDSIVPMLPYLQRKLVQALAWGREDFILNGDTAGTHEDSDTAAANARHRNKFYLGLRAAANDNAYKTDLGGASFTAANVLNLFGSMEAYGADPNQTVLITGLKGMIKLALLPEVITVDKFGPNATVLKGQLGNFLGRPIIVSEKVRQNLNATGVHDGVTTNKTVIYAVHTNGWALGRRKGAQVQVLSELYAESNQDCLLVTERVAWKDLYPIATNKSVWLGYNIQ